MELLTGLQGNRRVIPAKHSGGFSRVKHRCRIVSAFDKSRRNIVRRFLSAHFAALDPALLHQLVLVGQFVDCVAPRTPPAADDRVARLCSLIDQEGTRGGWSADCRSRNILE